jgi:lipoic acid synthetase
MNDNFYATREALAACGVNTVCESSRCPNIGECFSKPFATFLMLGKRCTRTCRYCAVEKGKPLPPDPAEPERIARIAGRLGLKHVIITSVTRDDLSDGGALQFVRAVEVLRAARPGIRTELLIPDFNGDPDSIDAIVGCGASVIGHNIETVRRLFPVLRRGSDYDRSLGVLRRIKEINSRQTTKSGIMVGLGETSGEVIQAMEDLKRAGCDMLTVGQYLCPDAISSVPVAEFIAPEIFEAYAARGAAMGFEHVSSGPFVRSSYMAEASYAKLEDEDHECHVAAAC